MKTICAALIVKDEQKIISRCIDSLKSYIDNWVIIDTGSTDKTKKFIKKSFEGIPGELLDAPWVNFGHNRTELIKICKGKADYLLLVDADMVLNVHDENFKKNLSADSYLVKYTGPINYRQKLLVKADLDWEYEGVTHEYIHCKQEKSAKNIDSISFTHLCDGNRRPVKVEEDVKLLEHALIRDSENERHMFYLAQSYFDIKNYKKARYWYEERIKKRGWEEEVYFSIYKAALCKHLEGEEFPMYEFAAAYEYRPERLEAVYEIIRQLRKEGLYNLAYDICKRAIKKAAPSQDVLFVDQQVYDYKLVDELSICAYWAGEVEESNRLCKELLNNDKIPKEQLERIRNNKKFAENKLNQLV